MAASKITEWKRHIYGGGGGEVVVVKKGEEEAVISVETLSEHLDLLFPPAYLVPLP